MAKVSLCMIVRDEEAALARCLESVGGFADEIVIADTGSTDGTVEIAARYTDRIFSFPWRDDFAAARNFAFGKGTKEYLFWLDADDVIPAAELGKLMELKARLEIQRPDVVMMRYAAGFGQNGRPSLTFYRERLMRNCAAARWRGRVHEAVTPFGRIIREEITIEHRKIKAPERGRNLRIFEKMLCEGEPFGPRERYYYGKELCYNGRYREAAAVLKDVMLCGDGWIEDRRDACRYAALCFRRLSEEEREIGILLDGLRLGVPSPELCCDIGNWFYRRGEYRQAVFWYRNALRNGKDVRTDGFVLEEARGYLPCLYLCACYEHLGKHGLAERFNEWAERFCPGSEACGRNREYFQSRKYMR